MVTTPAPFVVATRFVPAATYCPPPPPPPPPDAATLIVPFAWGVSVTFAPATYGNAAGLVIIVTAYLFNPHITASAFVFCAQNAAANLS